MIEKIALEVKELTYEELGGMPRSLIQRRAEQLYHMHELMRYGNHEGIYFSWIYEFPDSPTLNDFVEIALDEEQFNDCYKVFLKLIQNEHYL